MGADVLIIDDDTAMLDLVSRVLKLESFTVEGVQSGQEALARLQGGNRPDVIILDQMMPKMDGLSVCREIRKFSTVPIIFVSAVGDRNNNRVKALEIGADDFLNKPFSNDELVARIRAVLRRETWKADTPTLTVYSNGDLYVDFTNREAQVSSEEISPTPIEFRLLYELALTPGQVVPHETLLERVWGEGYRQATYLLHINFNRLRAKLGDGSVPQITNKQGFGYLLEPVEDSKPDDKAEEPESPHRTTS